MTTSNVVEPRMPTRTRILRPSLWTDASTGGLSAEAFRLYLGLATCADDAGYLLWRPETLAAHFYRFLWLDARDAALKDAAVAIARAGLLVVYDCNCILLPYLLRDFRVNGGNHAYTIEAYHRTHESTDVSVPTLTRGKGEPRPPARLKSGRVRTSTAPVAVSASPSASASVLGQRTSPRENDLKEEGNEPEGPAISWLATHGAALAPNGGKLHQRLCRLVEVHGIASVVATFEEMASASEATEAGQYVLGASNRLNPIPGSRRPKSSGDLLPTVKEAESAFERF